MAKKRKKKFRIKKIYITSIITAIIFSILFLLYYCLLNRMGMEEIDLLTKIFMTIAIATVGFAVGAIIEEFNLLKKFKQFLKWCLK